MYGVRRMASVWRHMPCGARTSLYIERSAKQPRVCRRSTAALRRATVHRCPGRLDLALLRMTRNNVHGSHPPTKSKDCSSTPTPLSFFVEHVHARMHTPGHALPRLRHVTIRPCSRHGRSDHAMRTARKSRRRYLDGYQTWQDTHSALNAHAPDSITPPPGVSYHSTHTWQRTPYGGYHETH